MCFALLTRTVWLGAGVGRYQMLPRHMRRRAMSYNIKRLPARMRTAAAAVWVFGVHCL